jgi:carbohydrate diacid regulator
VLPIARLRIPQLLDTTGHHARTRFADSLIGELREQPGWLELRATMLAWAESGFNLVRAAERLHIHRNTLMYRLDKITRLSGRHVREPAEGIATYLACLVDQLAP